jgi:hypothetical protein
VAPTSAEITFEEGTAILLAVRVKLSTGSASVAADQVLEFFASSGSSWTAAGAGVDMSLVTASTYVAKSHGSAVSVHEFVCNTGGGNKVVGVFSDDATSQPGVALSSGEETELWFSVVPLSGAATDTFQFRLASASLASIPDTSTFINDVEWTPVVDGPAGP